MVKKTKSKNKRNLSFRNWYLIFVISLLVAFVLSYLFKIAVDKFYPDEQKNFGLFKITSHNKLVNKEKSSLKSQSQPKNEFPVPQGRQLRVPILTYHYIGNNPNPDDKARDNLSVSPDKFEEEMAYLQKQGYATISLDTLYAALKGQVTLPDKSIILTFDDGYVDFYVNAYPILRKYNLHATSFIPTGLIGQGYYLNWDQIKEMDASGLISFQSHSVTHADLPSLSSDQLKYQLAESKKTLEAQLGKPVNFMAYPYGTSNSTVWQAAKEAGYMGAVGTWSSTIQSEGTIMDMPRIKIPGGIELQVFASRL
ncbi:polysaccharide deacetylase family protein [Candidatus Daviesbacteria bacterium]|nr:polysaccharide deacetylase family protein [Candidatus Daviesbacteria bacterium]